MLSYVFDSVPRGGGLAWAHAEDAARGRNLLSALPLLFIVIWKWDVTALLEDAVGCHILATVFHQQFTSPTRSLATDNVRHIATRAQRVFDRVASELPSHFRCPRRHGMRLDSFREVKIGANDRVPRDMFAVFQGRSHRFIPIEPRAH